MSKLYEGPAVGLQRAIPRRDQSHHHLGAAATAVSDAAAYSRRSTSPSPDIDALQNSSLVNAALQSTNPYLRAGVLAVANRAAASAARRSASSQSTRHLPSRSYSPQPAQHEPSKPIASSSAKAQVSHFSAPSSHSTKAKLVPSGQLPMNRRRHGSTSRGFHSPTVLSRPIDSNFFKADSEGQASTDGDGMCNVLITDGTVMEDIASSSPRRTLDHHLSVRPHGRHHPSSDPSSAPVDNIAGSSNSVHRDGEDHGEREAHKRFIERPTTTTTSKEDLFVQLMTSFSTHFGSIRQTHDYVTSTLSAHPLLNKRCASPIEGALSAHHRRTKTPLQWLVEDREDGDSLPLHRDSLDGRMEPVPRSAYVAPAVVVSFAASPDRRQVVQHTSQQDPPSSSEGGPTVAEQLKQLTFTCTFCSAKHMRGLQCGRCQRPLPQLRRCVVCNVWMRGNYCSTCGCRQPEEILPPVAS